MGFPTFSKEIGLKMSRLTDSDHKWGPLTWGKTSWNPIRLVFSTGGGQDDHQHNHITTYAFGYAIRLDLPNLMKPSRTWVDTSKYNWSTSPTSGYWQVDPREYGFSLDEGFLQIFLGRQTHDSSTTQDWTAFLPWTQWRFIRHSFYDIQGNHFWTEWERPLGFKFKDNWGVRHIVQKECPTVQFEVADYDNQRIVVTTRIEEREWRFGEGWFKWLSIFRKPKIHHRLDIEYSTESGPEKGSWKGGLIGDSIEMLPGETHEVAFRRYCDKEHRSKRNNYKIKFIGQVPDVEGGQYGPKVSQCGAEQTT